MNSWRRENCVRDLSRNQKYKQQHFFVSRAAIRDYKTTPWELLKLWVKQRGRCALTGVKLDRNTAQLDHILPRALGGADTVDNLRWLHAYVNRALGATHDDQAFLAFIRSAAQNISPL